MLLSSRARNGLLIMKEKIYGMKKDFNLDSLERTEDISVEDVRSLDTFKEWDEEQILELIRTLKTFSAVVYNSWSKGKMFGKEIALSNCNQPEIKIAA
jgi:hypothetical protein